MVDKKPQGTDVILKLLGKRQGFAHEASTTLSKGVVKPLNMVGEASLFANRTMAFGGKDFGIR